MRPWARAALSFLMTFGLAYAVVAVVAEDRVAQGAFAVLALLSAVAVVLRRRRGYGRRNAP